MNASSLRALTWLVLYIAAALLPLGIAAIGPTPARREFVVEFGVGLGFVALALFGLQFALTARFPALAAPFGLDRLLHFHRLTGILAFALVAGHVLLLITARREFLAFLDPRDEFIRAIALSWLMAGLTLLMVTTLLRQRLGIPYQWWRIGHALLALFVLFVATVHLFRVNHYSDEPWKLAAWVALALAAAALLGWARIVRPFQQMRRPWEVVEVRPERGRSWTIAVEPRGHAGMRFEAGQFAWLALDQPPYDIDTHPFSISSSAERPGRVEFTIKALGDFTSKLGNLKPGAKAYVDGPYGNFTLHPDDSGAVFITGGVGVTPAVSILRTMRDRGDMRPATLVFAARAPESAVLHDDIVSLAERPNVRVEFVYEEPPEGWAGSAGHINADMLETLLPPASERDIRYFVCGPGGFMDVAEKALRQRGVPSSRIHSERFNIA